jgi:phosphatidylethanolamine/phosphatidyl-N-methylethanolamine N-methyltransferase
MYAVSVVPDLNRMFDEVRRVCKPNGEFVLVNHFASGNYLVQLFENAMTPFSSAFGFHPNLNCVEIAQLTGMELLEARAVNAFGYWTLMRFRNHG